MNFRTKDIEIDGSIVSVKVTDEILIEDFKYDERSSIKFVNLNLSDTLKEKISTKLVSDLIHYNNVFDEENEYLDQSVIDDEKYNYLINQLDSELKGVSKKDVESVLKIEELYYRLLKIIPPKKSYFK